MTQPLISLDQVGLFYTRHHGFTTQQFWALKDVSFTLNRGDSLGVVGRNGVGKSTLLKLLGGLMQPDRGQIVRHGSFNASLLSLQVGFVSYLTGRENAILSGMLMGMTRRAITRRLPEIIEFSELGDFIDEPISTYSSGMTARLGFSVALQIEPDIWLIDEVLGVGDAEFAQKSSRLLRSKLQRQETTMVFVSHGADSVARLCNRALWLEDGVVQLVGDTDTVLAAYEAARHQPPGPMSTKARLKTLPATASIGLLLDDGPVADHVVNPFGMTIPRAAFDAAFYADRYPDIAAALGADPDTLWRHFVRYGAKERRHFALPTGQVAAELPSAVIRNGEILARDQFDWRGYAARYPGVECAAGSTEAGLWQHFVEYGAAEGRYFGPEAAPPLAAAVVTVHGEEVTRDAFDAAFYAAIYPQTAEKLGHSTAALWRHFVDHGAAEGRQHRPLTADDAAEAWAAAVVTVYGEEVTRDAFDAAFYAAIYPQTAEKLGHSTAALWRHFVDYGAAEGRQYRPPSTGAGAS